ncbi:hypothetical protein E2542_SST26377 [Spatholobus suberectus]|nr:hypothetical protein E2542_SST26377 [Spatholobus suberectus]
MIPNVWMPADMPATILPISMLLTIAPLAGQPLLGGQLPNGHVDLTKGNDDDFDDKETKNDYSKDSL